MRILLKEVRGGLSCFFALWREVLFEGPYRQFEAVWSILLFFSAITVLNPHKSLYGLSTTYKYLVWLPEAWFGAVLLFVSLNSLLALAIYKYHPTAATLRYRWWCSIGTAIVFSSLFILLFAGNSGGMLIPWLGVFGLISIITVLRLADAVRHEKDKELWKPF